MPGGLKPRLGGGSLGGGSLGGRSSTLGGGPNRLGDRPTPSPAVTKPVSIPPGGPTTPVEVFMRGVSLEDFDRLQRAEYESRGQTYKPPAVRVMPFSSLPGAARTGTVMQEIFGKPVGDMPMYSLTPEVWAWIHRDDPLGSSAHSTPVGYPQLGIPANSIVFNVNTTINGNLLANELTPAMVAMHTGKPPSEMLGVNATRAIPITQALVDELEKKLYGVDIPNWEQVALRSIKDAEKMRFDFWRAQRVRWGRTHSPMSLDFHYAYYYGGVSAGFNYGRPAYQMGMLHDAYQRGGRIKPIRLDPGAVHHLIQERLSTLADAYYQMRFPESIRYPGRLSDWDPTDRLDAPYIPRIHYPPSMISDPNHNPSMLPKPTSPNVTPLPTMQQTNQGGGGTKPNKPNANQTMQRHDQENLQPVTPPA